MEDAGKAIDKAASSPPNDGPSHNNDKRTARDGRSNNHNQRKRKGTFESAGRQQGSRKGGGRHDGPRDNKRHKKGDMGRGDYLYVSTLPTCLCKVEGCITD